MIRSHTEEFLRYRSSVLGAKQASNSEDVRSTVLAMTSRDVVYAGSREMTEWRW